MTFTQDLSYKDKHWHESCFLCSKCRVSLVDKQFGSKVEKIYCGNCYDTQFAARCDGCGDIFRAGKTNSSRNRRLVVGFPRERTLCCVYREIRETRCLIVSVVQREKIRKRKTRRFNRDMGSH